MAFRTNDWSPVGGLLHTPESIGYKYNWPKAVKKLLWFLQIMTKLCHYLALVIIHIDGVCHIGHGHRLLMWQLSGLEFWSSLLRPCRRRVDIASSASAHRRHTYVTHWRRFRGRTVQNRFTNVNKRLLSVCLKYYPLPMQNYQNNNTKLNLHHCAWSEMTST